MEKFIQKAGKQLAKVRIKTDQFLREQIGGSRTNLILFILVVFVLVILIVSAALNFNSLFDYYKIYLGLLILMVLAVIWAAIFYESEIHLESDTHGFPLEILKKSSIKYHLINLDETSRREFDRLLWGKNVKNKINFTMGNKSGDSANHRILFVLFDELIIGGIKDTTGERKNGFFQLLIDSFLMNGQPINQNTLKTSFSAWKGEQEKLNSRNQRKLVRQMLGKE
ncbi:MAG TPA: hypothetical protein VFD29_00010 [Gillisia sp.]|nr:hypothetical protein [Gillisia sp.]